MQTKQIKFFAREGLFVETKALTGRMQEGFKDHYTYRFYEDRACQACEYFEQRHDSICDECPNFKAAISLTRQQEIKGKQYTKLPLGDWPQIMHYMKSKGYDPQIKSFHPPLDKVRLRRPFKFTGTLKTDGDNQYQRDAIEAAIKNRRGVIKAPPRSGKTVIACATACRLGVKTMIVAAQHEWLEGFRETFAGSQTQAPLTTIDPKRIGFCKSMADFDKYDVCLVTYQTFIRERGQAMLRKIRDMFGFIVVDEVHTGAATEFLKVLNSMNCARVLGLSGTPSRKDGRYILVQKVLGPVIYEAKVKRLVPTIKLVKTSYNRGKQNGLWANIVTNLEADPARLKTIAQWAVRDVEKGHMVLIPFTRVKVIRALTQAINKIADRKIAMEFHGALKAKDRANALEFSRKYKNKVLVGNSKLLSTGTNIPRASALYEVTLSSNMEACEQRISRVLTPFDGKPQPIVRIFLDETSVRKACLRKEWYGCIKKVFNPIISESDAIALNTYLKDRAPQTNDYGWT